MASISAGIRKEYLRQYRQKNREKIIEQQNVYYTENREALLAKKREYYKNNSEKMIERSMVYYRSHRTSECEKNRRNYKKNKVQRLEQAKKYYMDNDTHCKKTVLKHRKVIRKEWLELINDRGLDVCSNCGYNTCFAAIDFHHIDPTSKNHSMASLMRCRIKEESLKELDKCIVLCSNCHREHHANGGL